jgi:hypothetical protein
MADHIEQSAVVILCISEGYAESRNCKAEYRHTFGHEKPYFLMNLGEEGWSIPMTGELGMVVLPQSNSFVKRTREEMVVRW